MLQFGWNKTTNLVDIFCVGRLIFKLQESFKQTLEHRNEVTHNLFYTARVLIQITYVLEKVPDNCKVLGNDLATSSLHNAKHKDCEESVFDTDVIRAV